MTLVRFRVRTSKLLSATVLALASVGVGAAAAGSLRPGAVESASPNRVLDTRAGLGANGNRNKVAPGVVLNLPISAAAAAGATSVVVNITATEADGPGWVKAWPCGTRTPPTSVLNFAPGRTTANAVVVQLGQGAICLSTYAPVHLVADVSGWFTGTTDFTGTAPNRITDTREANEPLRSGGPLQGGAERRIRVGGTAGVPPTANVAALNLTVVDPPAAGWIVAYPCGQPTNSSTVNFSAGEVVANLTFVALSGGDVCLRSLSTVNVVIDTYGWSTGTGALQVRSPQRLLDTRGWPSWTYGSLRNGSKITLPVAGRGGVPTDAAAALLTVTVANTGGDGFVTVWPCDQPMPKASTINTWASQLRSNVALVRLAGTDGTACLKLLTSNGTPVDLVIDVAGWQTGGPARNQPPAGFPPPTPATVGGSGHFSTLPPGSVLPADADCAAAVRPKGEIRPANGPFNQTRGAPTAGQGGLYGRITGNFTGTTDEIIQWAACKWGIDEDIVRAQVAKESWWFQRTGGDFTTDRTRCVPGHPIGADGQPGQCPESIGLMQLRYPYWGFAFPSATTSSSYNLDSALAARRNCFEGYDTWFNDVPRGRQYAAGDIWGCVGAWFSGRWYTDGAGDYIAAVQDYLNRRVWESPDFANAS